MGNKAACACGSARAMTEVLVQMPTQTLRHGLHFALMFGGGGSSKTILQLVRARADVNERFRISTKETGGWVCVG